MNKVQSQSGEDCFLLFNIRGSAEAHTYRVSADAGQRLAAVLKRPVKSGNTHNFFSFETLDNREVCVSVPDLHMADYGSPETATDTAFPGVRLFFRDSAQPVEARLPDDIEAFLLESMVESGSRDKSLCNFHDDHGKKYSFNLDSLVLMELSRRQGSAK